MTATIHLGDCRDIIATLADESVASIVTDPPYELGFMGKKWDNSGIAYDVQLWYECLRVLKPGGHLLAFGGTRTFHRMACAIEDAGFEIRDSIYWLYSSGFPKSHNVSKGIDKAAGALAHESKGFTVAGRTDKNLPNPQWKGYVPPAPATDAAKQWQGWGTALKPAHEPIALARKPLTGTVAANVQQHGTGALNIDASRVPMGDEYDPTKIQRQQNSTGAIKGAFDAASLIGKEIPTYNAAGRWPANVITDGTTEAEWDRYFFCAKASKGERNAGLDALPSFPRDVGDERPSGSFNERLGHVAPPPQQNTHPTVKPLALMRYLVRLVTPPGGTVLEPFAGSGTTLAAAILEGFDVIGCELTDDYLPIIEGRIAWAEEQMKPDPESLFNQ